MIKCIHTFSIPIIIVGVGKIIVILIFTAISTCSTIYGTVILCLKRIILCHIKCETYAQKHLGTCPAYIIGGQFIIADQKIRMKCNLKLNLYPSNVPSYVSYCNFRGLSSKYKLAKFDTF